MSETVGSCWDCRWSRFEGRGDHDVFAPPRESGTCSVAETGNYTKKGGEFTAIIDPETENKISSQSVCHVYSRISPKNYVPNFVKRPRIHDGVSLASSHLHYHSTKGEIETVQALKEMGLPNAALQHLKDIGLVHEDLHLHQKDIEKTRKKSIFKQLFRP